MSSRSESTDLFWASPLALVGSLFAHALMAWLIMTNIGSCGRQGNFGTGDGYREVGVFVIDDSPAGNSGTGSEGGAVSETTAPSEQLPELPQNLNDALNRQPENALLSNLETPALIGPGPMASTGAGMSEAESISSAFQNAAGPGSGQGGGGSAAGIPSTTSFFQIDTRGRSLVYVLDCSGSMSKHNAFRHAKAELNASLERLDSNHKFQIVFYNDMQYEFRDRHGQPDIHWATASNLTRSRAYISQMDNSGGTAHYPALMKALSYSPEVIFFLTDAAEPALSAKQLDDIQRRNQGKAAIHTIEFGLGPDLQQENFLKKLSRQNGGTYRYRDMSKLGS